MNTKVKNAKLISKLYVNYAIKNFKIIIIYESTFKNICRIRIMLRNNYAKTVSFGRTKT